MKRILGSGLLAAALLVPLSGCAGAKSGSGSASPTPKPVDVITAAGAKLEGQNLKFSLGSGVDMWMNGNLEAATGRLSVAIEAKGNKIDLVAAGDDVYVGVPMLNGKWAHFSVAKLGADSGGILFADPLFGRRLLGAIASAEQAAAGNFSGTIDLTKLPADASTSADRIIGKFVKSAGDKANAVPFTAVVDGDGRLNEFHVTFPGADKGADLAYNLKFLEIGSPVTVTVPPITNVVEAPPSAYKDLAG
jgi:hypothetical protein